MGNIQAKNAYMQANKDWLVAKSQEDGVMALPKGIFYKVLAEGDAMSATRGDIRQQPWRRAPGVPAARPHRGMDYCHAADAHRRPMGSLYPCRNGLRKVLPTRHPRRLHPHL